MPTTTWTHVPSGASEIVKLNNLVEDMAAVKSSLASKLASNGDGSALTVAPAGVTAPMSLSDAFGDVVRARMFGAVGDGVTDDTAALQAAIAAVKALPASTRPRTLYLDPGHYYVTDSLDGTYPFSGLASSVQQGWTLKGAGASQVTIFGALSTAHPILDMTGNTRGGVRGVSIRASSGSFASCGVLACRANNFSVDDCIIDVIPSATAVNAALVLNNSDLASPSRSEFYGRDAVICGVGDLPAGFTSKWQAIPAGVADDTARVFDNCIFNGSRRAFWHTGGTSVTFIGGYAAVTGSAEGDANRCVMHFDGNTIVQTHGLRIENQAGEVANAFGFQAGTQYSDLTGYFDVDVADAMIYLPDGAAMVASAINSKNSYGGGPVFSGGGIVGSCRVVTNRSNLGVVHAASGGLDLVGPGFPVGMAGGGLRAAGLLMQIAGGTSINRNATLARPSGNWLCTGAGIGGGYTGGSGLQAVGAVTVPASLLAAQSWATPVGTLPRARVGFVGASQVNGQAVRIKLIASQTGVSDVQLVDWNLPSAIYAGELIEIEATIASLSTNGGLRGWARIFAGGAVSQGQYQNLQGAGFVVTAPITLTVYFDSLASDPVVFETLTGQTE